MESDFVETLNALQKATSDAGLAPLFNKLHRLRPRGVRLSVCAYVKSQDGSKLLAVTRKEDSSKVCMPGGFVEPGDYAFKHGFMSQTEAMLRRAAVRELFEETALEADPDDAEMVYCALDDVGTYCTMHRFWWTAVHGLVTPEQGTSCLWLTPGEFMERCAWPEYYQTARGWEVF